MEIIRKLPRQQTNTFYKIKNIACAILKEKKFNFEIPIFLPIGFNNLVIIPLLLFGHDKPNSLHTNIFYYN